MKAAKIIAKIVVALAAVAGIVYVVATYGNQIVAWCKKVWNMLPKCPACEEAEVVEEFVEEPASEAEEAAPEAAAEEVPVEEAAPEVIVAENEPVAAEEDFAE